MNGANQAPGSDCLRIRDLGPVREIRLARPEMHNALDEELIAGLTAAFLGVAEEVAGDRPGAAVSARTAEDADDDAIGPSGTVSPSPPTSLVPPRAVLLSAEGKSFCAGADLRYMQRVAGHSMDENRADALRLAALFQAVRDCPVFVVGRVHGTAVGGGCGLVAACDLAIAADQARFGFTEVRLGIVPAIISPFVVARIGAAKARALFPTGEIFDAAEARRIGLVDRVVFASALDAEVDRTLEALLSAAPGAARAAKSLAGHASAMLPHETAELIARMRALPEGREGIAAFLEKREPSWARPWPAPPGPGEPTA
jgi:methylglutaconyl-CoA hydratase